MNALLVLREAAKLLVKMLPAALLMFILSHLGGK